MSIRRKIWERRIRNFWEDFSHNKIGILGLAIIISYVVVAFITPVLAPVNPETSMVANQYAYPEWYANLVPSLRNLPRTTDAVLSWTPQNESSALELARVTVQTINDTLWIKYNNGTTQVQLLFTAKWNYPWEQPKALDLEFAYGADPGRGTTSYAIELKLTTPSGANKSSSLWDDTFPIWDAYWWRYQIYNKQPPIRYDQIRTAIGYSSWPFLKSKSNDTIDMSPNHLFGRLGYSDPDSIVNFYQGMLKDVFGPPGEFTFKMYVTIKPIAATNTTCTISMSKFSIHIPGLVYGLLGTQVFGCDCWSRLIYGVRVSLAVGLVAAVLSTSLGILVGVVAGFMGGTIDELLMRVVDILICLPALPILIVLVALFGRSIWYIVLIIAVFGWQGLARMIRAQTLSIREMSFIECAQASGGSKSYIMLRHVMPNIMPIALADMVLSIPGAIVLEAALSFIGFGDPTTPTWGREFNLAYNVGSGFSDFIWWWVIPPGIAITLLCLAFVFVSHAIDEIVNPRLRRRR
jgi:ABC-type dipeptide/oligopeptide/nickel transport system permease subunit